jgi:hypothetical protein
MYGVRGTTARGTRTTSKKREGTREERQMGRRRRTGCNEDMFRKCEKGAPKGWYTKRKEGRNAEVQDKYTPNCAYCCTGPKPHPCVLPRDLARRHVVHTERREGRVEEPGEQSRVRGENGGRRW